MRQTKLELVLEAVDRASAPLRGVERAARSVAKLTAVAAVAGVVALTGAITAGVNEARKFESAMADVAKVADFASPAGLAQMSDDILDLSRRLPIAADGLATITAEALQSGVALEDALDFTELTAKAAVAFDMTADAAGASFAKLRNVFQLDQSGLEDTADAVNHLSNNLAAKAPQIIDFLTRAGGAAQLLGLSADEMAAFGSAMVALGTTPETAARGVSKLFMSLKAGEPKVVGALDSLGIVHDEFLALAKDNPAAAFDQLFKAVGQSENGLKALTNIVGLDFADDFLKLADNPALLAQAFALMADKADRAGSVLSEYEARAATFDNTVALFQNNLRAMSIELGNRFLPALNDGLSAVVGVMQTLDSRVGVMDRVGTALSAFGSGLGLDAAADGAQRLGKALDGIGTFLFGRDTSGQPDNIARVMRAADAAGLESIAARASSFGQRIGAALEPINALAGQAGTALDGLFGPGGAGRAALEFIGSFSMEAGGAVIEGAARGCAALAQAIGDIVQAYGSGFASLDFSGLTDGLGDLDVIARASELISGFYDVIVAGIDLGAQSLVSVIGGWADGFAPYTQGLVDKVGPLMGSLGSIIERLGEIFTNVATAFSGAADSEEAMGALARFGRLMGGLAGQLDGLSLDALGVALTFVDGVFEIIERLTAGDFEGALEPVRRFFDWLGSLTAGSILPDIDGGAIVATIKGWFSFEWVDILPTWDWGSIIPKAPNIRSWFSLGNNESEASLPAEPAQARTSVNDTAPQGPPMPAMPKMPSMTAVNAAKADVAALSADIDRVTGAAQAMPATVSAAMNRVRQAADLDLTAQGMKIMDTLAAGMRARAQAVVDEIRKVSQQVRDHLPSSPARTGPLSDLHRLKFAETIARSIRPQPMVTAMERAAALTRAAANVNFPVPGAPNLVSIRQRSPQAGGQGSAGAGTPGGPGGGVTVHAPLTIQGNVAFATPADRDDFEALLNRHSRQVAEAVDKERRRRSRTAF